MSNSLPPHPILKFSLLLPV